MSFEIHSTNNGPIILSEGKVIVLSDDDILIELCEKDESILNSMQEHISTELAASMQEFLGAIEANINASPSKIYSYLSAFQQFWMLKNHRWTQYLMALEEANADQ